MVEQRHAKFLFEVPNLSAQRRLGKAQPSGRAGHVLFFSNGDEVSQVAEFHSSASLPGCLEAPRRKNPAWSGESPILLIEEGLQ